MSLIFLDPFDNRRTVGYSLLPFGGHRRHRNFCDPLELAERQMERSLAMIDRLFDEDMNVQLRDHAGRLQMDQATGDLTYQVDVSGFHPDELKVDLQGDEIVIKGEHKEQNEGESVHRQFVRRVLIPEGIQKETIKCDLDSQGRLCVTGKKNITEAPRSIPIEIGKGQPAALQQQQEKPKEAAGEQTCAK